MLCHVECIKKKINYASNALMYLNVIVNAHLFNMFRQAKHLHCVISTLRPRYVSNTVMAEIMLHSLYVIKLFLLQVLYI